MIATLITGASGGIGAEFARRLARDNRNLVLVARSKDKLDQLANELAATQNIQAVALVFDLTDPDAPRKLFEATNNLDIEVDFLINNAGFGSLGEFTKFDLERDMEMIDLNVKSLVALTHLYLRPMQARRGGAIINVASTAAFQPVPFMTTYAATKAFVLSFSEALAEEMRLYNVRVMALCPGATETNFFQAAEGSRPPLRIMQTPQQVVGIALHALATGRTSVISGRSNYVVAQFSRLFPRALVAKIAGNAMRSTYTK